MKLAKSVWWAAGSIVLMLIGAFGPWANVLGFITVHGTDDGGDGWVVIAGAVVAAAGLGAFVRWSKRWLLILAGLGGCLGAATAGYDISNISSVPSESSVFGNDVVDVGWGIYLALVGSVSLILASIGIWLETNRRAVEAHEVPQASPPAPGSPVSR